MNLTELRDNMKLIKKILFSLMAINFAFLGLYQVNYSEVYAAEEISQEKMYAEQRENLQKAVDDYINVVSTNSYNTYVSAKTKADYETAIGQGRAILDKGTSATFSDLRQATAQLKEIVEEMKRQTSQSVGRIAKLTASVQDAKSTIAGIKLLFETAPNKVAKVRPQLEALIKKSETLIKRAEALL